MAKIIANRPNIGQQKNDRMAIGIFSIEGASGIFVSVSSTHCMHYNNVYEVRGERC